MYAVFAHIQSFHSREAETLSYPPAGRAALLSAAGGLGRRPPVRRRVPLFRPADPRKLIRPAIRPLSVAVRSTLPRRLFLPVCSYSINRGFFSSAGTNPGTGSVFFHRALQCGVPDFPAWLLRYCYMRQQPLRQQKRRRQPRWWI